MKIKVQRWSGRPISNSDIELFESEWKQLFDKCLTKCRTSVNANGNENHNMLRLQKLLARCEKSLKSRYPTETQWEQLVTSDDWLAKISEHGVLLVGKAAESDEIVYIIFDPSDMTLQTS